MNLQDFRLRQNAIYSIATNGLIAGAIGLFSINLQAQTATAPKSGEAVTLNFNNAEIDAVARDQVTQRGATK